MCREAHSFLIGVAAILLLGGGCEPDNDNDVGCVVSDCEASCLAQGFEGFVTKKCKTDGVCKCEGASDDPYSWDEAEDDDGPADGGADGGAGT